MRLSSSPMYSRCPTWVTVRSTGGSLRIFSTLGFFITKVFATDAQPSANKAHAPTAAQWQVFLKASISTLPVDTIYPISAESLVYRRLDYQWYSTPCMDGALFCQMFDWSAGEFVRDGLLTRLAAFVSGGGGGAMAASLSCGPAGPDCIDFNSKPCVVGGNTGCGRQAGAAGAG